MGLSEVWPGVPDGSGCKSTTNSLDYCAGTSPILNDEGCLGYGRITCALCGQYFIDQGLLENAEIYQLACPSSLYTDVSIGMCGVCPGSYFFRNEPMSATHLETSTIVLFAGAMSFTLCRIAVMIMWVSASTIETPKDESKEG